MSSLRILISFLASVCLLGGATTRTADAVVVKTSDPNAAAAFMSGALVESFDDLSAMAITNYAAGQTPLAAAEFNTRDGATQPTFNSGDGSFSDPLGDPGTPIAILDPEGAIAGDVKSPNHVAGPLTVDGLQLFNNGFIEVFFAFSPVARVGFWVTHGSVNVTVLDSTGNSFNTGDTGTTAMQGEFVGIDRGVAEIGILTVTPFGDSFTIDDLSWSSDSLSPPTLANRRLAFVGHEPQAGAPSAGIAATHDGQNIYALGSNGIASLARNDHTGVLNLVQELVDGVGGVNGLGSPIDLAISPDDRHVYVTSSSPNGVVVFARDPSDGTLSQIQALAEGQGGVTGIVNPLGMTLSPDGSHLYVAGHVSQAIATFARDSSTGLLSYVTSISDGIADVNGLSYRICMSDDGRHLYAGQFFNSLSAYERDALTGVLSLVEVETTAANSTGACAVSRDGAHVYSRGAGNTIQIYSRDTSSGALSQVATAPSPGFFANELQISPSGDNLFVHSGSDRFAMYQRDPATGWLSLIDTIENGVAGVQGIGGGFSESSLLTLSPDGRHVYVVGDGDDAIGIFSTSVFRPVDFVKDGEHVTADTLLSAVAIVVGPDSRFAYVASVVSDAVAIFEVDAVANELVFLGRKKQGEMESANGLVIQGLDGASGVALSPNADQLYVASTTEDAVAWFDRNDVNGELTYRATYTGIELDGATALTVTNDGSHVYVAAREANRWVAFERAPDGALTQLASAPIDMIPGTTDIVMTPDDEFAMMAQTGALGAVWAHARQADGSLVPVDGFSCEGAAEQVAVSGDGGHVYLNCDPLAAGEGKLFAVAWDASAGQLSLVDEVANDPLGAIRGMDGVFGVAISPDDRYVAATGWRSNGFVLFARDTTGKLFLAQQELQAAQSQDLGLEDANDIVFSPDGRYLLAVSGSENDTGGVALFVPEPAMPSGLLAGLGVLWGVRSRRGRRAPATSRPHGG